MERWSTSLVMREMQIKIREREITNDRKNNKCWWRCGETGTLVHCWWECKMVQPLWKTVWSSLKKLKIELPYDPAILPLNISEKMKVLIQKDTSIPMFIKPLFTIAKIWKQLKHPSTDKWIKKMRHIYTMEYYSAIKKNEFCHLQQHGWTWRALC